MLKASCQEIITTCNGYQRAGTLPMAAWANLSNVRMLTIKNNSMTGTLPSELARAWPKLATLELSQNHLARKVPIHIH